VWIQFGIRMLMMKTVHAGPGLRIDARDPASRACKKTFHGGLQNDRSMSQGAMIKHRDIENIQQVTCSKNQKCAEDRAHFHPVPGRGIFAQFFSSVYKRLLKDVNCMAIFSIYSKFLAIDGKLEANRGKFMESRSVQKQRTRRKLIEVALELSAQKGFSALSLREVSQAADLTPAGFYRHFRDMEELGLALLDEVGLSLRRFLREARKRADRERGVVQASVDAFMEYVNDNANLFRLLLGERQGASTAFRKAIHAETDQFVGELTEDLEREAKASNRPIAHAAYAAEAIVAVVFTVGAEALELPRHKQESLSVRLIEEVKMILRGARINANGAAAGKKSRSG
jgi:TetR/AcrR family transcriptional regulator, fatty acid biosynthesis regulator